MKFGGVSDPTLDTSVPGHDACRGHPGSHDTFGAPITRTIRGIPTEVRLAEEDGMPTECAVSLDNLRVVPKSHLVQRQCALSPERRLEACGALRTAVDC